MKNIISILCMILILMALSGCAKVISTEEITETVRIIDTNYRGMMMVPMKVGKVQSFRTISADYDTTVEYNGVEYYLDSKSDYDLAKDRQGQEAKATIVITKYDDGTEKISVKEILKAE